MNFSMRIAGMLCSAGVLVLVAGCNVLAVGPLDAPTTKKYGYDERFQFTMVHRMSGDMRERETQREANRKCRSEFAAKPKQLRGEVYESWCIPPPPEATSRSAFRRWLDR